MNGKQVKRWAAVSFMLCYVFLMVSVIVSKMNTWLLLGETRSFVTVLAVISRIIFSAFILAALILLIYSDNVLLWFDKTRIGKWILVPVRSNKK